MEKKKKYLKWILVGLGEITVTGILFYRSIIGVVLLSPYLAVHLRKMKKRDEEERKWIITDHFCEAVKSIAAAMEAGYSVENALKVAAVDLTALYSEEDVMVREMNYMYRQVKNSVSAERAFAQFAARMDVEDIRNFSDVFSTAKRTGGDIISIINKTMEIIVTKHEVRREVRTLTQAKRFETAIMKVMPFGILAYLGLFSPEMCEAVYAGVLGRVFMSVMLALYIGASELADRIVDISM